VHAAPPQVLLGNLEPMMLVGLRQVLVEDGAEVIGQERSAARLVTEARRLQPDVVLLDRGDAEARAVGERVRRVAPRTKVILCARDETLMEVLDPASAAARLVPLTFRGGLRSELSAPRDRQ
jgi:DNA-binding NarL/FixJ family response regulator